MRSLTLTTLIALSAAGCASPGPRAPHGGPPSSGRPGGGSVFFSPAGEPFRSSLGEPAPMARWFAGADADHDGRLSPAEFTADHRRFFKVLDADGDGRIDGPEVGRYETVLAPEILGAADRVPERPPEGAAPGGPPEGGRRGPSGGRRAGGRGGGGGRQPAVAGPRGAGRVGAARYGLLNEPEPVRAADLDLDYRVSAEEWDKAAARRLAALDRDHDGALSPQDLGLPGTAPGTD
jgi:hypothetical protein